MSTDRFKNNAASIGSDDSSLHFIRPAELNRANFKGVVAEGVFEEALVNQLDASKKDFRVKLDTAVEVTSETSNGDAKTIKADAGDTVVINGAGNLGYLMSKVPAGELCRISYNGMIIAKSGPRKGKEVHSFEVLFGEE